MIAKKSSKAVLDLTHDVPNHGRDLLLALSRVAQSFQRARTADDFYCAVGREVKSLGGNVTLLTVNEDKSSLIVAYTSYESKLIRGLEKLMGGSATGYSFAVSPDTIYAKKLASGNAEYIHWKKEHIMDALPLAALPMIDQIMSMFNIKQSILAPLRVDDETLGLMMVSGLSLNEDDVPIMDSFAGQIAAGLQNVRLMQKLQDELSTRKNVEKSLYHNRNLLLALSSAAQAVQLVREPEEIYRVVGEQIQALGFEATILMFGEGHRRLYYRYTTLPEKVIHAAEKMVGFKAHEYNWSISPDSIYDRIIKEGRAEYIPEAGDLFAEALPSFLRPLSAKLIQVLKVSHGILAPLQVGDESFGVLIVFGSDVLSSEDLPAIDSFAGQVSASLRNAWLAQQVENELKERKQAEAALRASEAKIHALMDAIPDMMFMLDYEGKFIDYHAATGHSLYVPPEVFMGKNISEVMPSQMVEAYRSKFDQAVLSGKSQLFEYALGEHDTLRYFEAHLVVYQGDRVLCVIRDITRRKNAEDAVRQTERHFKALIEKAPDGITLVGSDGLTRYVSPSARKMFGYDIEEVIHPNSLESIHPDDLASVLGAMNDLIQNPAYIPVIQYRYRHKDGSYRWVESTFSNLLSDPSVQAVVINFRDITERKQTQEALAASLAELHALFTSMQDAVLVIDRNGVYQKIAPTNPNKFYLSPEEVIGRNLSNFFSPAEVDRFLGVIQQVLKTQQTMQIEYKLEVKGLSPWFEASISPMDANNTIWVARDISERKQVEAKLHLQSAALEAAANTIIITDRKGIIQWANSAFSSLTGFEPKEAIGNNPGKLMKSGKQTQEFYEDLWSTILSGKTWHNELINCRKDGSLYFEEMTITPLRNSDDAISHFIAVKQDITERKRAEEALIKSEQDYRTLFENMPIGLYRTSADGHILDANMALINMFGYPDRSSLLAMKAEDLYAEPELNNKFKNDISIKGMLSAFESEYRRYDQQTFWAEDYVHVIRDEAGKPLYYEGSLINITDRKKAENDLRQANKSLQLAHSELQQMFTHEQILARTDSLTGQTNRRYFFELAVREFNISIRHKRPLTIMLFDIDGFKQVNDTLGHALGDTLLIQVAQTAAAHVRTIDVLARYGGDEFIILLPETTAQQTFLIAERIREKVASMYIETDNDLLAVTLSIGIAEIICEPPDEFVENVIRRADQALYQAKKNGRNHTFIYT